VLVLRFYQDLSVEQTAEVLGVSPGAVRQLTARALAAVRAAAVDGGVR
jgi:DNA-directed RNA polymerase specialized sigma24 family protein